MDIKNAIVCAVQSVIDGVNEAKTALKDKATVDYPTRIELEFGITASYEVANYDDIRVATVRVAIPLFYGEAKNPALEATRSGGKKQK